MVARIYDKDRVALSTYIDFGDKSLKDIKAWFHDVFYGALQEVRYIYSLKDDKWYRWSTLTEMKFND